MNAEDGETGKPNPDTQFHGKTVSVTTDPETKQVTPLGGMTAPEAFVMRHIVEAWHGMLDLRIPESDLTDARTHIHALQRILAGRVAARLFPDYWQ